MQRSPTIRQLGQIWIGVLLLALATLCASAASPKRVLILNPYGHDVAPFSAAVSEFRATLGRELGEAVDIYEVPLDLARIAEKEGEEPLASFLEDRIKNQPVDLVVTIGGSGVQFAARHRERLFPNAPVLVVATDPRLVPPGFLQTNATLVTNAPLFGYFESEFGLGPIGGHLFQDAGIGARGARTAIRILHGERPDNIPPEVLPQAAPVYDWRELQRLNISAANLPPGSRIEFRQPGFWEHYRWWIFGVVVFCVLQMALILALIVNRFKRRQGEEKVSQLTHAIEQSPALMVITDRQGNITYVNPRFSEVTGYSFAETIGRNPRMLKSGETPPATYQELWNRITSGKAWRGELHNRKKNGELYWESAVISPLLDATGMITHFVGVKQDITEKKQTEVAMHDLSRRLIRAHEAERSRLGRELHDDVTQRLAILAIDAGRVEHRADQALAETMRSIREGLVRLSEDIHALSYRLHPSILVELGLAAALRTECERFTQQEAIATNITLPELPAVPPETALCLFRGAQEALRNVTRHAQARQVEITVRPVNGNLQLIVQDDGIGFDSAEQRAHPSLGLASMRERVLLVEGELDIESAPGQGTTIMVTVPVKNAEE